MSLVFGVKLVVFSCSGISESSVFEATRISMCHNMFLLSSPNLRFIKGLIRDLFVSCVDYLMGKETFMRSKCLV